MSSTQRMSRAMKPSDMLHKMCELVLAGTDIKALCKARGLPSQATSSRSVLETLFLSPQGVSSVFNSLDRHEIALLHLLKNSDSPVDVAFFSLIYGGNHSYGTFNQRFQNVFAKVKQRFVRGGVLLLAESRQNPWDKKAKMERWRFALPAEFHIHLPPLIQSPRQFEGDGSWRSNVVRDKLSTDLGRSHLGRSHLGRSHNDGGGEVFRIEAGELRLNGKRFKAAELIGWQQSGWKQAIQVKKKSRSNDAYSKPPDEAAGCILSDLADGFWADAERLAEPMRVFCGNKVDADAVCKAGWEWGLVAKRQADGKTWYRLSPEQTHVAQIGRAHV